MRGALALFAAVGLVTIVVVWRIAILNASFAQQDHVLTTVRLNAKVLRLQVDEETGIRGYAATGDRALLESYTSAASALDDAIGALAAGIEPLHVPEANTDIDTLRSSHDAWLQRVALPTLRERSARTAQLEVEGEAIIDRFRAASARLDAAIDRRVNAANAGTRNALIALTAVTMFAALGVAWLISVYSRRQGRLLEQIDAEQTIIEQIPQMVWTKDARGVNDYCNRRFRDYMNLSVDEFINDSWIVVHPEDVSRGQAAWRAALATGTPYETELRLRPRNLQVYRWFLVRGVPQRDASGRVVRWFGTTTDIDAQRRATEALAFLAESGAGLAGVQDVPSVLDRLARASLDGLADISIFDLEEEDGTFRRLVLSAPTVSPDIVRATGSFDAPRPGEPHPIAQAMRSGETIHVPDVDEDFIQRAVSPLERQAAWRFVDIRSMVVAPMLVPGRVLGALTLLRIGANAPFATSDVRTIEEVARRAAVAIDNLRFTEREHLAARNLQAYAAMGESVADHVGLQATLHAAMHAIVPARADWAFITLADERGDLRLAAVAHPNEAQQQRVAAHIGEVYASTEGADGAESVASEALRTRSPVLRRSTSYATAAAIVPQPVLDALWHTGMASIVVAPFFAGSAVRGTIHLCMEGTARAFTRGDLEFFAEFARRLAPAIANAELFERERRIALSFQAAALPASLPNVPGFTFRAIYEAGKAEALVGGDWFDAFTLPDGRIVVSIGDVAGSGLSAAVTMSSVRQAIRGAAHVLPDPGVMLDAADRVLDDPELPFVTCFVGIIDPSASTITYQSAGHPPALLYSSDGTLTELAGGGPPLGLHARLHAVTATRPFPADSLLVLYTDGLIEATRDVLAGEARVREALCHAAVIEADNPAQLLRDAVLTDGSRDDVAILTIRRVAAVVADAPQPLRTTQIIVDPVCNDAYG